jgi:hypothetical protein
VVTKLKDVDNAVRGIIGLNREQFSQVAMISQGDFRRLLQADTRERQKIFRDIFGTELFLHLQNQLKDRAADVRDQRELACRSIQQYISGMVCDAESPLSPDVKKAKAGELPMAEITELFDKLLEADRDREAKLDADLLQTEKALEQISAQLTQAQAYTAAKNALTKYELAEKEQAFSADYFYETLMQHAGHLKPVYAQMLTLYRGGKDRDAFQYLTSQCGSRAAINFSMVLSKVDRIQPDALAEQMDVFIEIMSQQRMTAEMKKVQRNSLFTTVAATAAVFISMIDFAVVVVFMHTMTLMEQAF